LKVAAWAEGEPLLAAPLFVLFQIIAVLLMFPVWGIFMIGGYLFGTLAGIGLAWIGFQIGSLCAFLFARTVGRNWVKARFSNNQKFKGFETRLNDNGFKAILITRLTLIFPTNMLNLLAGISSINVQQFVIGSAIGSIPLIGIYTFFGAKSANLIESISNGTFVAPQIPPGIYVPVILILLGLIGIFGFRVFNKKPDR